MFRKATLMRLNIAEPTQISEVVRDFRSAIYFLVGDDAVGFNCASDNGNVVWKCSRKGTTRQPATTIVQHITGMRAGEEG
jgi:hypothetical protein